MSRLFCLPGIFFLLSAAILSLLVSISLPFITTMDIARVHFRSGTVSEGTTDQINQVRLGIWAACSYLDGGDRVCKDNHRAYRLTLTGNSETISIPPSYTRGLAVHPVATAVTFIALLLAFSTHHAVTLIASLVSFLAALLTLIAFAIDIALFVYTQHQAKKLNLGSRAVPGPGFWLTFVSMILLALAGCTVCFGRRKDRMAGATSTYPMAESGTKPGFMSRFRRNRAPAPVVVA